MYLPPFSKNTSILFFLFFVLILSACTKIVSTELGGDLIPPVDGVNTKEIYLDVVSKNAGDTVTRVGTSDEHALGYVTDPMFGKITASINVQLKPASFPFSFPVPKDSIIAADSVVLVLGYKGVWGDSTQPLSFRVYNVLEDGDSATTDLDPDSAYLTNRPIAKGTELTENSNPKLIYPTNLNDSVYPFTEAAANQLRIRLNASYASQLFATDTSVYASDSVFSTVFKGYQIVPQQMGNSLLKISLTDTNTKLAVYFRFKDPTTVGKIDTAVRYFRCNQYSCGSSNFIQRDRSGTPAQQALPPFNNDILNDSLLFVDGNPGIYARLQIPGLDTLTNKIIHRAEILMEQAPDQSNIQEQYLTAPALFLAAYSPDSMRKFALPNDVTLGTGYVSNQSLLGCFPYKKTDSSTGQSIYAYNFDISRYVQGIITKGETIYPLVLYAPSVRDFIGVASTFPSYVFTGYIGSDGGYIALNAPATGRVRLGGGHNSIHKMRLHIVYSDIK